MDQELKYIFSFLATVITFVIYIPYIRSTLKGKTKPHVFSWVVWGLTTMIVFFAQLEDDGGAGAWPHGVSGALTICVAVLAYFHRADISIAKTDWLLFIAALASLPFWYMTADPLWAVVILTGVDVLGFGPTLRKAYHFPWDESVPFFALFLVRNTLAIVALENYSTTTLLFPLMVNMTCLVLVVMVLHRRKTVHVN